MTGYEAYRLFLTIRLHFTSSSFNYQGYLLKAKEETYESRKDRYFFEKVAKKHGNDLLGFYVSNMFAEPNIWVGKMNNDVYKTWKGKQENLNYRFFQDLRLLLEDEYEFNSVLIFNEGNHPKAFRLYLEDELMPETLLILDNLVNIFDYWLKQEDLVVQEYINKLIKYAPFINLDSISKNEVLDKIKTYLN